jgi:hypothetical protein
MPNFDDVLREKEMWQKWLRDCKIYCDLAKLRKLVWRQIILIRNGAPSGKWICKDVCRLIYAKVFAINL